MTVVGKDGSEREVSYIARRFLPDADELTKLTEHTVNQDERPDNIAAKYLGDPTLFWRLCDANDVFHPDELTDEIGERIVVAMQKIGI